MRGVWFSLCVASAGAWAQVTTPSVVAAPLDVDPTPALVKVDGALRKAFFTALVDKSGVATPLAREMERFPEKLKRTDFRESNEALAQLAAKAGTLYAVYAEATLTEGAVAERELIVSGRVVRDDGKVMGTAKVQTKPGKDALVDTGRVLFIQLFERLGLKALPTFREKPETAAPVAVVEPKPVAVAAPVAVVTPLAPVEPRASLRGPGIGLLVGGGVALIGGLALAAAVPTGGTVDANGNLVPAAGLTQAQAIADHRTARTLQPLGVTTFAVGAAAAITGAFLVFVCDPAAERSARAKVALVPTPDGAVLSVGGTFP